MLTTLAWIWIGLGALFVLISLFVGAMVLLAPEPLEPRIPDFPHGHHLPGMTVINWLFAHFGLLATAQLLLAALVLLGGIYLLEQRAWARTVLEGVSWLGLVYGLVWNGWFVYFWLESTAGEPAGSPTDPALLFFRVFGVGAAVLSLVFYGGPLAVLIWMLRHRTVRGALVGGD